MTNKALKILNFGSLNYDYVYTVEHIVQPGETISSSGLEVFCGGKGLNQSVAMARAGAKVYHAGLAGSDDGMILATCDEDGINRSYIKQSEICTGNAIIQVDGSGQNSIVLFGGANQMNTREYVHEVFENFGEGDVLLLQNEVNLLDYMVDEAYNRKMVIALNPSPFDDKVKKCDLSKISIFLMNEVEGVQITGEQISERILEEMLRRYPKARVVLTLGKKGVAYSDAQQSYYHGIYDVKVVDTTAAGDTFTGYFLASILNGEEISEALRIASVASSLAVTRKGAIASIPYKQEIALFNQKNLF